MRVSGFYKAQAYMPEGDKGLRFASVLQRDYESTKGIDPKTLLGKYAAFARKLGTENYIALFSAEM